jgi:hypothetical protein
LDDAFGPGSSLQFRLPTAIALRNFHFDPYRFYYPASTQIVKARAMPRQNQSLSKEVAALPNATLTSEYNLSTQKKL